MHDWPRYYQDHDGSYFRVSDRGVFATWNPNTGTWFHVTAKGGRDYLSRAIESGDASPVGPADLDTAAVLVGAPMTEPTS